MHVHDVKWWLTAFLIFCCKQCEGAFIPGNRQREWSAAQNRRQNHQVVSGIVCAADRTKRIPASPILISSMSAASALESEKDSPTASSHKSRQQHKAKNGNSNEKQQIRSMFQKAKNLERTGQWREAANLLQDILDMDPRDSHSHLALARLEARRERTKQYYTLRKNNNNGTVFSRARQAFQQGTDLCPNNVHLLQAWAMYEQSCGNIDEARDLFEKALKVDEWNPYVNHAYGLMEKKLGNTEHARELWEKALERCSTAALVCSLGEQMIAAKQLREARDLYVRHLLRLHSERERTEVYLASAWLEERYFSNLERAEELINLALIQSPGNSRAHVALARLEGRMERGKDGSGKDAAVRHLANACINIENGKAEHPTDGRLFNAWANLEVKSGRLPVARKILMQGMKMHPKDQSLFQAAGKVEERVGNYTGARELYSTSLLIEPSAPTLVAYAMLELRHPEVKPTNHTKVSRLFEEALLLDPRHGPAYNAYGNMELRRGNVDKAREIYERGVDAQCTDVASVYHGLAKLELSLGRVEVARELLVRGLREVEKKESGMDSSQHDRAAFLAHTLGMLELNSNRAAEAMEVFQNGITSLGNSSQLLLGAALCEVKLGKEESARKFFKRAVNADKKHAQAWQAWGVMEMRAGNFRRAQQLFDCGIRRAPKHGALWTAYATMEGRMGNSDTARTLFAAGIEQCPNHVALYQGWASLEMRNGNYVVAKRLITEALTRDKARGSGWLVAAEIEKLQGNDGLVGLLLRRGIECAPHYAELYCALGEYLVSCGKYDDARQVYEEGLEVNPLHAPLYHSFAELEARLFNVDGLAELNKRAAELFNSNAMTPSPSSSKAWGKKIQNRASRKEPKGVAALSQKIGDTVEATQVSESDPTSALDSMVQVEDELVQDLFRGEDVMSDNGDDKPPRHTPQSEDENQT